jgi:hypothetical protein
MTNILDAGKLMTPSEYEFIRENCYNFLKKQTMALAYAESLTYYEKGDYDELYSIIGKAYKKSFGIEALREIFVDGGSGKLRKESIGCRRVLSREKS